MFGLEFYFLDFNRNTTVPFALGFFLIDRYRVFYVYRVMLEQLVRMMRKMKKDILRQ